MLLHPTLLSYMRIGWKMFANDRAYFVIMPQLVCALCEDPFQLGLWLVVKMVAGESGECGTLLPVPVDRAAGHAGNDEHRQGLAVQAAPARAGPAGGRGAPGPGYPQPVYHLRVPDLWRDNLRWRKEHDSLADRIAFKVAQRAGLKAAGTSGDEAW